MESPNDWVRIEKKSSSEINERGRQCLDFWNGFAEYARQDSVFMRQFKLRKSHPHHWFDISIGIHHVHIVIDVLFGQGCVDCGLYITDRKDYFEDMKTHSEEIEQLLGSKVEWREARKDCRILLKKGVDLSDTTQWQECYRWFLSLTAPLKQVAMLCK